MPNLDALQKWATSQNLRLTFPDVSASLDIIENSDLYAKEVISLYKQDLTREVKNRAGYRPDDRNGAFKLILELFSMDNGMMNQPLKIKRPVITSHYQDMINSMFL